MSNVSERSAGGAMPAATHEALNSQKENNKKSIERVKVITIKGDEIFVFVRKNKKGGADV
jgi:6-phosphogluconolactonase/glucosamine-6-phosphate isomerase/deaminase